MDIYGQSVKRKRPNKLVMRGDANKEKHSASQRGRGKMHRTVVNYIISISHRFSCIVVIFTIVSYTRATAHEES